LITDIVTATSFVFRAPGSYPLQQNFQFFGNVFVATK